MMYGTAEDNADTDADGMNDGFEIVNGLDAFQDDGMGNPDGDGFVNAEECVKGTDPKSATSGGDGSQVRFYYDLDDRLTGAFFATNGATQYGYGAADNIAGVHERRAP
jgi:YD repeat-containing protein